MPWFRLCMQLFPHLERNAFSWSRLGKGPCLTICQRYPGEQRSLSRRARNSVSEALERRVSPFRNRFPAPFIVVSHAVCACLERGPLCLDRCPSLHPSRRWVEGERAKVRAALSSSIEWRGLCRSLGVRRDIFLVRCGIVAGCAEGSAAHCHSPESHPDLQRRQERSTLRRTSKEGLGGAAESVGRKRVAWVAGVPSGAASDAAHARHSGYYAGGFWIVTPSDWFDESRAEPGVAEALVPWQPLRGVTAPDGRQF
jgi:hypothetical protein